MNNCLVSRLKGIASDNDLPRLGITSIKMPATSGSDKLVIDNMGGTAANPLTLKISNGAFFKYHNEEPLGDTVTLTTDSALKVFVNDGGGRIDLIPKYNLHSLNISKYKLVSGKQVLSGLIAESYVFLLSDFSYCEGLYRILGSNDYNGDISELSRCIELSAFSVSSGNVTGEIKDLVGKWIDNGRASSGSMTRFAITPRDSNLYLKEEVNITLNGIRIVSDRYDSTLHWESKNKIYMLDGDKVRCTGYTDEEIAENTGTGGIWEGKTAVKY